MIKTFLRTIRDSPIGEQRSETTLARIDKIMHAANIQESLLLTGKRSLRKVLCSRARTNSNVKIVNLAIFTQLLIRLCDRHLQIRRNIATQNNITRAPTSL